jgi:hypothetical protein
MACFRLLNCGTGYQKLAAAYWFSTVPNKNLYAEIIGKDLIFNRKILNKEVIILYLTDRKLRPQTGKKMRILLERVSKNCIIKEQLPKTRIIHRNIQGDLHLKCIKG